MTAILILKVSLEIKIKVPGKVFNDSDKEFKKILLLLKKRHLLQRNQLPEAKKNGPELKKMKRKTKKRSGAKKNELS